MVSQQIDLEFNRLSFEQQNKNVDHFLSKMKPFREVKSFSSRKVKMDVIEKAILAAGTSPSGANQQPWRFVLITKQDVKRKIKKAVIDENSDLVDAPILVALFKQKFGVQHDENSQIKKVKHYYPNESVAICGGFFISALNQLGLDYKLYGPVKSLNKILNRPENEEHFMLFSVGYAEDQIETKGRLQNIIRSDCELNLTPKMNENIHFSEEKSIDLAEAYYQSIRKRRNVRHFSTEVVDKQLIEKALQSLKVSPFLEGTDSFKFFIISNQTTKDEIRRTAEAEEKKFYEEKITEVWADVLKPLGTDWQKSHLSEAPFLIVAFKVTRLDSNEIDQNLFSDKTRPIISSGVNTGILMNALHHTGLCMLTHTPSPMTFLRDLLNRPQNEMPVVVLPVGYPTIDCKVPNIRKKTLENILVKI